MMLFLCGFAVFFGLHIFSSVRTRNPEADIRKRMGEAKYMGLYSVVSVAGFAAMLWGYGQMRPADILYTPPAWGVHANMAFMLVALVLLVASQIPAGYIKKKVRHPMLAAVKLWAVGHLLSNGELNAVILFVGFLAYAVFSRIMCKRRGDNGAGDAIPNAKWDVVAIVVGVGAYVALIMGLHTVIAGVAIA